MRVSAGRLVKSSNCGKLSRNVVGRLLVSYIHTAITSPVSGDKSSIVAHRRGRNALVYGKQLRWDVRFVNRPYWFDDHGYHDDEPDPELEALKEAEELKKQLQPHWLSTSYPLGLEGIKQKKKDEQKEMALPPISSISVISKKDRILQTLKTSLASQQTTPEDIKRLFGGHEVGFQSLMREARVERGNLLGRLLVDEEDMRRQYDYWLQLLQFRARLHERKGIVDVWCGMMMRQVPLPVRGATADKIWRIFIEAGLEDETFLMEVWKHADYLHTAKKGRRWKGLYESIVGGFMIKYPDRAKHWHAKLISAHWPRHLDNFFKDNARIAANLPTLYHIFASPKISNLYSVIIPFLCREGYYSEALKWSAMLFRKGDVPKDSSPADMMFEYLTLHKSMSTLEETIRLFLNTKIPVVESTFVALIRSRFRLQKILKLILDLHIERLINIKSLNDRFWSSLLAYRGLHVGQVKVYMRSLGIDDIGNASMNEIVKRSLVRSQLQKGMVALRKRNIKPTAEVVSQIIQAEARTRPNETLQEAFQIKNLEASHSNALLKGYLETHRWKHFRAVLGQMGLKDATTWNLLLQRALVTRDFLQALGIIEEMRLRHIPSSSVSVQEFLRLILVRRRKGRKPTTRSLAAEQNRDLFLAIEVLQNMMYNGTFVHPRFWREVITRLGMFRKLKELEKLCLWLVDWYHPNNMNRHRPGISVNFTNSSHTADLPSSVRQQSVHVEAVANTSPGNYLRLLFPATTIRSLVEWGFLATQRSWFLTMNMEEDIAGINVSTFTSGIRLVRKLCERGVWVDKRSVARAIRVRLRAIDGTKDDWESFDINMSNRKVADLSLIAAIAEEAWGEVLFPRDAWETDEGIHRMLKSPVKDVKIGRSSKGIRGRLRY